MANKTNNLFDLNFEDFLAVVSILGFTSIFIDSISQWNAGPWVDGLLFMIIGSALMVSGGIQFVIKYLENGLTNEEITKILTIIVGFISFVVGIFTFPLAAFEPIQAVPIVDGIKTVVSALAIVVIFADTWIARRLVK